VPSSPAAQPAEPQQSTAEPDQELTLGNRRRICAAECSAAGPQQHKVLTLAPTCLDRATGLAYGAGQTKPWSSCRKHAAKQVRPGKLSGSRCVAMQASPFDGYCLTARQQRWVAACCKNSAAAIPSSPSRTEGTSAPTFSAGLKEGTPRNRVGPCPMRRDTLTPS
jgi:hypothetical protein